MMPLGGANSRLPKLVGIERRIHVKGGFLAEDEGRGLAVRAFVYTKTNHAQATPECKAEGVRLSY